MTINNAPKTITAGITRRLLAAFYDAFLLVALIFCTAMVYTIIVVTLHTIGSDNPNNIPSVSTGEVITELERIDLGWPIYPLLFLVYITFYCYFWIKTGQTLGMQAWKIKLVNDQNTTNSRKNITLKQCLVRLIVALLSIICFGMGYLWLIKSNNSKTWHDALSNTRVILIK